MSTTTHDSEGLHGLGGVDDVLGCGTEAHAQSHRSPFRPDLAAPGSPASIAREPLRLVLFSLVIAAYVTSLSLAAFSGLQIDYATTLRLTVSVATPLIAGILYFQRRGMTDVVTLVEAQLCGLALTFPIGLTTYLAMRAGHPLADETLAFMDRSLGFDWLGFVTWVDQSPWLAKLLAYAYSSFAIQLTMMPVVLFMYGQGFRSTLFVINYGLICFLSSLISVWFPAVAAYSFYAVDPGTLTHINAYFGFDFLDQFRAVRADPNFTFGPETMKGILTFPSVHAAIAVLCSWASWRAGLLRYPLLALNGLMALSAVSHGGHYLVDVIAGICVAAAVISTTTFLSSSKEHA